jgi:hypothetical protein
MITITYRQLGQIDETDSLDLIYKLERYIGSQAIYGIDTPISILDIMEHIDVETGALCLGYVSGIDNLRSTMAIECLRAHLTPWDDLFPGDTRVRDLLDLLTLYIQTKNNPVVPRLDSCGDPIPGFYGTVSPNQITDLLALIQASSDALDLTGIIYEYSYWGSYSIVNHPSDWWYVDVRNRHSYDPTTYPALVLTSYTSQTIATKMADDPDYYFRESYEQFDTQTNPSYTGYMSIIHASIAGPYASAPVDYAKVACQLLVAQLSQAVMMTLYDGDLFLSIVMGIKEYMRNYATEQRFKLQSVLDRLYNLTSGKWAKTVYPPDAYTANVEQQIIDVGLNLRAALLRSVTYVNSFDSNASGTISATERVTMENDVRAQMVAARATLATIFYTQKQQEYNALPTLYDMQSVLAVLTPYLI